METSMCGSGEVGRGVSLPQVATRSLLCSWREIALIILTGILLYMYYLIILTGGGRCEAVDFIRTTVCKWNRVQPQSAC